MFCVWWCLIWPFHRWHRRVLWVFVPSSAGSQRRSLLTTKQTKTKRPALSSLMRTCCIIYTVHVSWTHFSRTLYYSYFRADTVVTQKRTGCDFGFTPSTLMSLCLSLTLSPLWLLSYVTEPDDVWRTTGEVIMCSDVRGDDPLHGHTLLIKPSTCFFWFPCSFSWSSSGWLTVTGFLSFGHDVS